MILHNVKTSDDFTVHSRPIASNMKFLHKGPIVNQVTAVYYVEDAVHIVKADIRSVALS